MTSEKGSVWGLGLFHGPSSNIGNATVVSSEAARRPRGMLCLYIYIYIPQTLGRLMPVQKFANAGAGCEIRAPCMPKHTQNITCSLRCCRLARRGYPWSLTPTMPEKHMSYGTVCPGWARAIPADLGHLRVSHKLKPDGMLAQTKRAAVSTSRDEHDQPESEVFTTCDRPHPSRTDRTVRVFLNRRERQ